MALKPADSGTGISRRIIPARTCVYYTPNQRSQGHADARRDLFRSTCSMQLHFFGNLTTEYTAAWLSTSRPCTKTPPAITKREAQIPPLFKELTYEACVVCHIGGSSRERRRCRRTRSVAAHGHDDRRTAA